MQGGPKADVAENDSIGDSIAPTKSARDSLAAIVHQQRTSYRIDSIQRVIASRRQNKDHGRRPSLRSGYDDLAAELTSENVDSIASRLDSIVQISKELSALDSVSADSVSVTDIAEVASKTDSLSTTPNIKNVEKTESVAIAQKPRIGSKIVRQKVDIEAPVDFAAKDSLVMMGQNTAYMYGDAKVKYTDIDLAAAELRMDMKNSTVYAVGREDSVGDLIGKPVFKDKSGDYESKTMKYNFKSGRGYITDVVTQQGEGFLTGGRTKKMEDNTYFMENGKYTTCDDHEHPHFYMQLTKAKVTPKKNVVSGPAYMVLCDVPLPLAVPFGYFPFSSKYSSGIIVPTFGDDYNKGFYLSDGGYYFAINDYVDLALTGEIYTKGSWGLAAQSTYR